jgi:uncharacterized protein (TIGR03437 family)
MRQLILEGLLSLALTAVASAQTYPYAVKTLAGVEPLGNGGPASSALLDFPWAVAVDSVNNIYIADGNGHGIRKINSTGLISAFSTINAVDLKIDSSGNIYAADGVSTIYKITPAGVATAIAGGSLGFGGDGGPATAARLNAPSGIAFDSQGNLYIADTDNCRVRKVAAGTITTVAGGGICGFNGDNGQATAAQLAFPTSVAVDNSGNIYISEYFYIRKVIASSGLMTTIAGQGSALGNGLAINAAIGYTDALLTDNSGNLYVADPDFNLVRVITGTGIRAIAGTSPGGNPSPGFSGDGGPGNAAQLFNPTGLALDSNGFLYIADQYNQRIRKLDQSFNISTIAGAIHYGGDNGPAVSALLDLPEAVAMDSNSNIYFADTFNNRVRRITPAGVITTVAGTGACGYSGDGGPAIAATLCHPFGIAVDSSNNLFIADSVNSVVREVGINGFINTIAGTGDFGDTGDNVGADKAQFEFPYGLAFDSAGNLYISDWMANRVRKMTPSRVLTYFAGTSKASFSGDGGLATSAAIDSPQALATDSAGNVYIADAGNGRVRKVSSAGIIGTVAGTNLLNPAGTTATSIYIGTPGGMAVDSAGNLFISEMDLGHILEVAPSGAVSTIAGNGAFTFSGDGLALNAALNQPAGMLLDPHGNLLFADRGNSRIRELIPDAPTQLSIKTGDSQTGNAGAALLVPLTVSVAFQAGVPVAGVPVAFSLTSGLATLSAPTASTDSNGLAGIAVTLGNAPGPVVVTASLGSLSVTFHLTAVTPTPLPTISAGGVDGAGGSLPAVTAISPGGLASLYGVNLAPAGVARSVQGPDLVNGVLPTNLAGVCVQIDGLPAFITYVSPGQVNIQVPAVHSGVNVPLQVTTGCGSDTPLQGPTVSVPTLAATPEFLFWVKTATGVNPAIAVNAVTGDYIGVSGLIPGIKFVPAKPGDYLTIYGVSFGATNPTVAPGAAPATIAPVSNAALALGANQLSPANLLYVGATPGTAGLYQVNIQVPIGLSDGDYPLSLTIGNVSTPTGAFLTVKN